MTDQTAIVIEPAGPHRHSIIWLHGLGADGSDFAPLVDELALPVELGIRWVFPHAPVMPVTINAGYRMRAWYDIVTPELNDRVDAAGIRRSRDALLQLMAEEQGRGIPSGRIILAGFSQGGAVALSTGLAAEQKPAGVLALSTYLPLREAVAAGELAIFQAHGEFDDIVPLAVAEETRDYLAGLGLAPEWHQYPMPHSLCGEEIDDIRAWLLARMSG
jgi:phospholipase/carboxylesterase